MFWQKFSSLCLSVGKSPNAVAKELGIPSGSVTAWRKGVTPRISTIARLADYFSVSTEYLSDAMPVKKSPSPAGDELDPEQREAVRLVLKLKGEDLRAVIAVVKAMLGE